MYFSTFQVSKIAQNFGEIKDRRLHYRYPYLAKANFGNEDFMGEGWLKNLSLGGILVGSDRRIHVGADILVTIPYAKLNRRASLRGTVIRTTDNGFALTFQKGRSHS